MTAGSVSWSRFLSDLTNALANVVPMKTMLWMADNPSVKVRESRESHSHLTHRPPQINADPFVANCRHFFFSSMVLRLPRFPLSPVDRVAPTVWGLCIISGEPGSSGEWGAISMSFSNQIKTMLRWASHSTLPSRHLTGKTAVHLVELVGAKFSRKS